jgi:hypothetical protein
MMPKATPSENLTPTHSSTPEFMKSPFLMALLTNTLLMSLRVTWCDGSTSWEALKDLKEANPIETAEYAVAYSLSSLPAFSWWVTYTLKKRDRIISAVKARFIQKYFKFGIKVPDRVAGAR